jgi:RNA-directed DNA polymerase
VRYADDFVLVFEHEEDARRVQAVLPKRFGKYGLQLHPEKTRLVRFERPRRGNPLPGQFDLLGFTHRWELSRRGYWVVVRRTSKSRFRRALAQLGQWCRENRHEPLRVQQRALASRLRGHDAYFGITGNFEALRALRWQVYRIWHKWLSRRSQRGGLNWERFWALLLRFPLPRARVVHSVYRGAARA